MTFTRVARIPCVGLLVWISAGVWAQTSGAPARSNEVYSARVTRVVDGDTLWVQPLSDDRLRKLRLDGLDAPEICQDGGAASRDALQARVLEQVVVVRERRLDDFGRPLARLEHAGDDVGAVMVRQGMAWSYRWRRGQGPYARQEAQARIERQGIFGVTDPENPRDFRRRHGPCPFPPR
ncbi:MAG: thermonuclease family protein [Hydrogenophaga sp.]